MPADALIFRESHTASASAELDFTSWYSASYDEYLIEIVNLIPATNNVAIRLECSTDGGSTYDTGANYNANVFAFNTGGIATAGGGAGQSSIPLHYENISNASDYGLSLTLILTSPGSTSLNKFVYGYGDQNRGSGASRDGIVIACVYVNTSAVNAFRIIASSGNLTSGIVRVYGFSTSSVAQPVSGLVMSDSEEGGWETMGCPVLL